MILVQILAVCFVVPVVLIVVGVAWLWLGKKMVWWIFGGR
jgi:hypothetical protein